MMIQAARVVTKPSRTLVHVRAPRSQPACSGET